MVAVHRIFNEFGPWCPASEIDFRYRQAANILNLV